MLNMISSTGRNNTSSPPSMSTTNSKTRTTKKRSNINPQGVEQLRECVSKRDTYYVDYDNGLRVSMTKKEYEKYYFVKKRIMTGFLATLQEKSKCVTKSLKRKKYKKRSYKKRIYIDDDISKKMSVVSLNDHCESLGGWVRDLTEEGVEPNPGPLSDILRQNSQHEQTIHMVETFTIYFYQLKRSLNRLDMAVATANFLKHNVRGSLFMSRTTIDLVAKAEFIIDLYIQSSDEATCLETLKDILDKYDMIKHSKAYKKLYKFFMYMLSLSIFDKFGISINKFNYTKIEEEAIRKRYYAGPDFVHCLLDTVVFLYTRGVQCMKLGRIDPLYHDELMYSNWALKVQELKGKSLVLSNPEPHGFSLYEYLSDLKHTLDEGRIMYRASNGSDKVTKAFLGKMVGELEILNANAISKREAQKTRMAPFALLLQGGSSVAKSTLTQLLFSYFGKLHDLPVDDEFLYTRNPADDYWVNFNTVQWGVLMDDIAYLNPNKCTGVDKTLNEIIQVVNSTAFVPTQAALEDKGRTPMRAKLVLATTNTLDLNANTYFSCPLAVLRRLPYIAQVVPKDEYSVQGMLDGSKVPPIKENCFPNYWNFKVYKVVPNELNKPGGTQYAQHRLIHEFDDIDDFLQWYGGTTVEYFRIQDKEQGCKKLMKEVGVCKQCYRPKTSCQCPTLQSETATVSLDEHIEGSRDVDLDTSSSGFLQTASDFMKKVGVCKQCYRPNTSCKCPRVQSGELTTSLDEHIESVRNFELDTPQGGILRTAFEYFLIFVIWLLTLNSFFFENFVVYYLMKNVFAFIFRDYPLVLAYVSRRVGNLQRRRFGGLNAKTIKLVMGVGLTVLTGSVIYKCFNSPKDEFKSQGGEGSKPVKDKDKIPDVWYKDGYMVTDLDISRTSTSMKGLPLEKVEKLLFENCVTFVLESVSFEKNKVTRGFCIGGQFYLVNNHGIPACISPKLTIICNPIDTHTREKYVVELTESMIYRWPEKDLCMLWIPQVRPRRNYTELFCKNSLRGVHQGYMLDRERVGTTRSTRVVNIRHIKTDIPVIDLTCVQAWYMSSERQTLQGDCGSIVVSFDTLGPVILGMHTAAFGKTKDIIAIKTSYEDVLFMKKQFDFPLIQAGIVNYSSETSPQVLGPLNKKAEVRFIPDGNALVYGSFEGHRSKPKSHVVPSPLSYVLSDYGYKIKHGKPEMKGWEPWYLNLLPSLNKDFHINVDEIMSCAEDFAQDIFKGLSEESKAKLIEYDDFTVTNGAAGVRFVDKMNRNTSAGFPFNKSKRHFINDIPPQHDLQDPVEFNDEIKSRIQQCRDCYDEATQYHPIYTASLKDEPRSFKKIKEKNTRVFTGGPVEHVFVTRKELLSYTKVMQENKFVSECAAGTIAQSVEWDHIYKYLTYFGEDRIFDGDHSKFDKSMESVAILAVFRVITRVLEMCGADDLHIQRSWCIGYDLAFAMINYNGTLLQMCKGHVSGEALTVLVNSHCNSLYIRCAYKRAHPKNISSDFKQNINLLTYGDDFVGGVNTLCDFFDFTILKNHLADMGLKITPADKEAGDYELMNIKEINFLKRNFRFEEQLSAYVCPLETDSIEKSLMVNVKSKTIPEEMQSAQCIGSAIREYFWHGREIFENQREFLKHIVSLTPEVEVYVDDSTFPTWESLKRDYMEASRCIKHFSVRKHHEKYL